MLPRDLSCLRFPTLVSMTWKKIKKIREGICSALFMGNKNLSNFFEFDFIWGVPKW